MIWQYTRCTCVYRPNDTVLFPPSLPHLPSSAHLFCHHKIHHLVSRCFSSRSYRQQQKLRPMPQACLFLLPTDIIKPHSLSLLFTLLFTDSSATGSLLSKQIKMTSAREYICSFPLLTCEPASFSTSRLKCPLTYVPQLDSCIAFFLDDVESVHVHSVSGADC